MASRRAEGKYLPCGTFFLGKGEQSSTMCPKMWKNSAHLLGKDRHYTDEKSLRRAATEQGRCWSPRYWSISPCQEVGKEFCSSEDMQFFLQNSRWLPLCCSSWRRKMPSGWCALSSRNWFLPPTSAPPWWACRLTSVSCDSSSCSTCPAWTSCSRSTTLVKMCPGNHSFSCQGDSQTKIVLVSQRESSRARSKHPGPGGSAWSSLSWEEST